MTYKRIQVHTLVFKLKVHFLNIGMNQDSIELYRCTIPMNLSKVTPRPPHETRDCIQRRTV